MCDLDPKVKVIGKKAGICDGVPLTAALVVSDLDYINRVLAIEIRLKEKKPAILGDALRRRLPRNSMTE